MRTSWVAGGLRGATEIMRFFGQKANDSGNETSEKSLQKNALCDFQNLQ